MRKIKILQMKTTTFYITIASLLLAFNAHAQKTDFTGDWKINIDKTNLNGAPASFAGTELMINQGIDTIEIQRTSVLKDSVIRYSEKLNLNGNLLSSDLITRKRESSVKWSGDKKELIETALVWNKSEEEKTKYTSIETFALSSDKSILYYTRQVISKEVNFTVKAVYDRIK